VVQQRRASGGVPYKPSPAQRRILKEQQKQEQHSSMQQQQVKRAAWGSAHTVKSEAHA